MSNKQNILAEVEVGDIFSESVHYVFKGMKGSEYNFLHVESGQEVSLSSKYVQDLLTTADQYFEEKEVTKEDKKNGDWGIRTIWDNIHSTEVFTVEFRKADTVLSATKLKALKEAQANQAIEAIEKAKSAKKGVANAAKLAIEAIQNNPINPIEPGELRVLRGYKVQFMSNDGKYDVIDMELLAANNNDVAKCRRAVNINTIKSLVYKGVKYNVK